MDVLSSNKLLSRVLRPIDYLYLEAVPETELNLTIAQDKQMSDYCRLPDEILAFIFLELPVKSLGNCLRVCKQWNSLITDPVFISSHLDRHQTVTTTNHLFFTWQKLFKDRARPGPVRLSIHSIHENKFVPCRELEFPKKYKNAFQSDSLEMVGSLHGVTCLYNKSLWLALEIFLWNPTVDKLVILPKPASFFSDGNRNDYCCFIGFGFDPNEEDYKVVKVTYPDETGPDYTDLPMLELYSLRASSWSVITYTAPPPDYYPISERHPQVCLNGIMHWPAGYRGTEQGCNSSMILWFDLSKIVFGGMMLPEYCYSESDDSWISFGSLAVIGGSLAFSDCDRRYNCCYIWTMEEYGVPKSWKKLYAFEFRGPPPVVYELRSSEEREILLLWSENSRDSTGSVLASYNPFMDQVGLIGFNGIGCNISLEPWRESLVLLESWNAISGKQKHRHGRRKLNSKAGSKPKAKSLNKLIEGWNPRMIHGYY